MTPFRTILAFVFVAAIGLFLLPRLPVDLHPTKQEPVLTVTFDLPDASPRQVEQEATAPLENILAQISQIREIYSTSNYHAGTIEITFDKSVDFEFKKFEVASAIRQIYPKLNPRVGYPQLAQRKRQDQGERVLLLYRIYAPLQTFQIKEAVESIFLSSLSQTADVGRIEVTGATGLQVVVEFDPQRLRDFQTNSATVAAALQQKFGEQVVGATDSRAGRGTLVKLAQYSASLEELRTLPVLANAGVTLDAIANIYLEAQPATQLLRINGKNAIALAVYADQQVNRLALAAALKDQVDALRTALPTGYQITLEHDDTDYLRKEIRKTYSRSGLAIAILIVFVFVAYRHLQQIFFLLAGVAITFCLTALGSYLLGLRIHLYSIAGLTIAFGILLDNLIMVVDATQSRNQRTVFPAVTGAAFSSILCLCVIFFLPAEEQENLREFAVSVMLAICMSVVVALFFIPAAARIWPLPIQKKNVRTKRLTLFGRRIFRKVIARMARHKKVVLISCILAFGTPVFLLPTSWEDREWYNNTIGSDWYQEHIRPVSDPLLGGTLRAFVRNVFERGGYRSPEKTRLFVQATLPYGHTLADMDRVITGMENYLAQFGGVERFVTHVYSGQFAQIEISFDEKTENGAFPYQLKSRLIAQSLDWGGVEWNVYGVGRGFSNSSAESLPNFKVQLKGYNYNELARQAETLADELLKHKRIQKVNTNERLSWFEKNTDEWVLDFSPHGGSDTRAVQTLPALREATGGMRTAPAIWVKNNKTPVLLRGGHADQYSMYEITRQYVPLDSAWLQLAPVVSLHKRTTLNAIHKENRQYLRQVGFDYYGSYQFGNEYLDETLQKFRSSLPPGYAAEKSNWLFDWNKVKRNYALLAVLLVLVYLVSAILFESLFDPVLVAVSIPFSFIGIFAVFGWGGFFFDQGGYAAFVLQASLAVASAMYMVTAIRQQQGRSAAAVCRAVFPKIKPLLLSMISTVLGLLPFIALGDEEIFWFALATGTMGGMAASAVYVFFVVPALTSHTKSHHSRNSTMPR